MDDPNTLSSLEPINKDNLLLTCSLPGFIEQTVHQLTNIKGTTKS